MDGTPSLEEFHGNGKITPPQNHYRVVLGGSFSFFCPAAPVPELEGWPRRKSWTPTRALGAIFLHPHEGGHKAFLLLSIIPSVSDGKGGFTADREAHTVLLNRTELFRHEVLWLGPVSCTTSWYNGRFRGLRGGITRDHTPLLWSRFGPPDTEGHWLANLLQPRALPITHRVIDRTSLQTWFHL